MSPTVIFNIIIKFFNFLTEKLKMLKNYNREREGNMKKGDNIFGLLRAKWAL